MITLVLLLLSTYLLAIFSLFDLNIQNSGAFLCHSFCCSSAIGMICENFTVLSLVPQRDHSSGTFAERAWTDDYFGSKNHTSLFVVLKLPEQPPFPFFWREST